jgi:hypothetical protein
MSVIQITQKGDLDPGEEPLSIDQLNLALASLALFLIGDVLEKDPEDVAAIEGLITLYFARRYGFTLRQVWEAINYYNRLLAETPFGFYLHSRNAAKEGFRTTLAFNPAGAQDMLDAVRALIDSRPFKDEAKAGKTSS